VLHVGDDVEPVTAEAPYELNEIDGAVLHHQPVASRLILTLPDGYDAAGDLGLDGIQSETFDEISEQLMWARDPRTHDNDLGAGHPSPGDRDGDTEDELIDFDDLGAPGDHWIGGLRTGVQGHPTEPGTVLLLHLSDDDALGFAWGDGGAFQFRIDEQALARRDWASIVVHADCG
jgi:hypothetical protein